MHVLPTMGHVQTDEIWIGQSLECVISQLEPRFQADFIAQNNMADPTRRQPYHESWVLM